MNVKKMIEIIETEMDKTLEYQQKDVIKHEKGPLWIIAGPGSGKTMVLVLRCLKLLCIDKIPPKSIIITTFTEKAAKNIHDRLVTYKSYLEKHDTSLSEIDISHLYLGTLHSLCNDIMHEYRYDEYQNYRLLDDIDQMLYVYDHSPLVNRNKVEEFLPFWQHFSYLVNRYNWIVGAKWTTRSKKLPHRWTRAQVAKKLFNRICEDRIDVNKMRRKGGVWEVLTTMYNDYVKSLEANKRCDFAHLQLKFLNFLRSSQASLFVKGDGTEDHPGVLHVLVDEYQDTNSIQEEIYLELANRESHNLAVVGDDDQALYRFRGGTVECMVNFDAACRNKWGESINIHQAPLSKNFRSNPEIVAWVDNFIKSFREMTEQGARVSNKHQLVHDEKWLKKNEEKGLILGDYKAVSYIVGHGEANHATKRQREAENDVAEKFAQLVRDLYENELVQDYNHMVLLLPSTQMYSAGPYQNALENLDIPVYNPRARTVLDQEEIQTALGAIITILDPKYEIHSHIKGRGIQEMVTSWLNTYHRISADYPDLSNYIEDSINRIDQTPSNSIVTQISEGEKESKPHLWATIQEIFYHLLSFEPFRNWKEDPARTFRLGLLSNVLEAYSSTPFLNSLGSTRGELRTDSTEQGINRNQLGHFYYSLIGLLVNGGLSDPEDKQIICPPGYFPIMTIHQAKGLQFPIVFTAKLGETNVTPRDEHQLELDLHPFRMTSITINFSNQIRAVQDCIRRFFVAYSRAEYALILLTTEDELTTQGLGFGGLGKPWFQRHVFRLEQEQTQEVV